nr:MAG TPA: hypothetical protein [Caudoviricetes sp.]
MAKYLNSDGLAYFLSKLKPLIAAKADTTHTHNYAGSTSPGGSANSVANSLSIQLNSGAATTFNGSVARSINVTASAIGAAASSHTHTSLVDSTDASATCSMSYAASSKKYNEYDWIAVWDGTTLKSASKDHFAVANHSHNYVVDSNDSSRTCYMAYSADEKKYGEYTYVAVWDGSVLKTALKTDFATSDHIHTTLIDPVKSNEGLTNVVSVSYYSPERSIGGDNDFDYLAAWNKSGNTVSTVPRSLFALSNHTHGTLVDPALSGSGTTNYVSTSYYSPVLGGANKYDYLAAWNEAGTMIGTVAKSAFVDSSRVYHTTSTSYIDWKNMGTSIPTIGTLSSWNGAYDASGGSVLAYCNKGAFDNGATTNITYGTAEPSNSGSYKDGDIYIKYSE